MQYNITVVDWDKKYRNGSYDRSKEPHGLLKRFWQIIPGKTVIDVASGRGRDAAFLAEKGFTVFGLEKSIEAIYISNATEGGKTKGMSFVRGDAAAMPFKPNKADCVTVFYFLLRPIVRDIAGMVKKGGILIYETFLKRQNDIDLHRKGRNPEYLLEDAELVGFFRDFEILFYEEGISASPVRKKATAKFVGRKRC